MGAQYTMEASSQRQATKLDRIKHDWRISEMMSMMMEMDYCGNDVLSVCYTITELVGFSTNLCLSSSG